MIFGSSTKAGLLTLGLALLPVAALADPTAEAARPAPAPTPQVQGAFGDWSLYEFEEGGYPVCYLASRMMKSSQSIPGRGPSFVLVTSRPAENRWRVVSVVGGYPYQDGSSVTIAIGRRQFHLFTDKDTAWAEDEVDPLIVHAIQIGSTLNVRGTMKDGPVVEDNFSLKGSANALTALDKACPPPHGPSRKVHRKRRKHR